MKSLSGEIQNRNLWFQNTYIKSIVVIFLLLFSAFHSIDKASATTVVTGSSVTVAVDYIEEVARITKGSGNSFKFYMSTDKQKSWQLLDTEVATGGSVAVVDISAILSTKDVLVYFKGNKDTKPVLHTFPAEDKTLKPTFKNVNGEGIIELNTAAAVEYRKGTNGVWKTATNKMPTSIYAIKGATLYFRTPATVTKRAGKTVSLKIAKRPTAPSVKVDGSKLYISGMKTGQTQYRVGDNLNWTTFTSTDSKVKTMDLTTLLGVTTSNTPIPAGIIEFRTLGTLKKITSTVKVIEIPVQQAFPDGRVTVTGTTLKISDDSKVAYEYAKVEGSTNTLNLKTAKWIKVTSAHAVIIPKLSVGDKVYVRLKSKADPTTKQIIPASTYKEFPITTIS